MKLDEIKKPKVQLPDTREEVATWTEKDWDELWNNPTPEKVLTWCHGNNESERYLYMRKTQLKHISVKGGRVNFGVRFWWRANKERLPLKLGSVRGDFTIFGNDIISTTEGFPSKVDGDFSCNYHNIKKVNEMPSIVKGGTVELSNGPLSTLNGIPDIKNLKLHASDSEIESLDGAPKSIVNLQLSECKITSLKGIHLHGLENITALNIIGPIKDGLLDLLKIKFKIRPSIYIGNIDDPNVYRALEIVRKYIKHDIKRSEILDCQQELIDADLEDYA